MAYDSFYVVLNSVPLLRLYIHSFVSRASLLACWYVFMALLKSLLDISNMSVLASFHCLSSFSLRYSWCLVWWMIFIGTWTTWVLWYCTGSHLNLCFSLLCREREVPPHCYQVQVPPLASMTPRLGGSAVLVGRGVRVTSQWASVDASLSGNGGTALSLLPRCPHTPWPGHGLITAWLWRMSCPFPGPLWHHLAGKLAPLII